MLAEETKVPKCAGVNSTNAVAPPDGDVRNTPIMRVVMEIEELAVCPESLQSTTVLVPLTTESPAVGPPVSVTHNTTP
jgi:hypothetical protein